MLDLGRCTHISRCEYRRVWREAQAGDGSAVFALSLVFPQPSGEDGGLLLVRLTVTSPEDLTGHKAREKLMYQVCVHQE